MKEKSDSLKDFWYRSINLETFRTIADNITEPCATCGYLKGCFGCRAIMLGYTGDFYSGDITCTFKP
jgi:radical SAM protein with 4Fe4S-binding SPASM domain